MSNERKDMHDNAERRMEMVAMWMKTMRSMMPEQMAQTMDDIMKTLQDQAPKP